MIPQVDAVYDDTPPLLGCLTILSNGPVGAVGGKYYLQLTEVYPEVHSADLGTWCLR